MEISFPVVSCTVYIWCEFNPHLIWTQTWFQAGYLITPSSEISVVAMSNWGLLRSCAQLTSGALLLRVEKPNYRARTEPTKKPGSNEMCTQFSLYTIYECVRFHLDSVLSTLLELMVFHENSFVGWGMDRCKCDIGITYSCTYMYMYDYISFGTGQIIDDLRD